MKLLGWFAAWNPLLFSVSVLFFFFLFSLLPFSFFSFTLVCFAGGDALLVLSSGCTWWGGECNTVESVRSTLCYWGGWPQNQTVGVNERWGWFIHDHFCNAGLHQGIVTVLVKSVSEFLWSQCTCKNALSLPYMGKRPCCRNPCCSYDCCCLFLMMEMYSCRIFFFSLVQYRLFNIVLYQLMNIVFGTAL